MTAACRPYLWPLTTMPALEVRVLFAVALEQISPAIATTLCVVTPLLASSLRVPSSLQSACHPFAPDHATSAVIRAPSQVVAHDYQPICEVYALLDRWRLRSSSAG